MNHLDRLNAKLKARERILGYTVYMPNDYVLREYLPENVDYILFDCEHGPLSIPDYAPYYPLCRDHDIPVITRVPDAAYAHISRAMDLGSDGILLPRVETLEQVRTAVESIHFPPDGKKGYSGKFQLYPNETMAEYRRRRILWIQIESPTGAELLPEILRQYGQYISACVIGPFDLSISLGVPTQIWDAKVSAVVSNVFSQCEAAGISSGIYVNDEDAAARRIQQGANLLWMGCDAYYMLRSIAQAAKTVAEL